MTDALPAEFLLEGYPPAIRSTGLELRRLIFGTIPAAAETGFTLDPHNPFVHRSLGSVYVLQGKLEQSIAANLKAVELNPSYALGYWGAGQQLALCGRANEALAMIRMAIRLSPLDPLMTRFKAIGLPTYVILRPGTPGFRSSVP